ncbi:MAG: hypothetical protein VKM01_05750, partial [Cyanobacteriota bacterium]|nr:hypothetical protein [Cyanobacteriota bacterium]
MYWSSPFLLDAQVQERLAQAGLQHCTAPLDQCPEGTLLVYVQPHALLAGEPSPGGGVAGSLLQAYRQLLACAPGQRLMADWRVLGVDPQGLAGWLQGQHPCPPAGGTPPIPGDPLLTLLLRALVESTPELLDTYLDLELQAELAQTPVDSGYGQRLLAPQPVGPLLEAWWAEQRQRQLGVQHLAQAGEESEGLRQALHQAQEQVVFRQQQLELQAARATALEQERERYAEAHHQSEERSRQRDEQVKEREQQLAALQHELQAARGEAASHDDRARGLETELGLAHAEAQATAEQL